MLDNVSLSRKQERFLHALLLGKSIVDSAKDAGVTEQTAHRWLKQPALQAERTKREAALAKAEQAEIERILTSGYALMHRRVEALDRMVHEIEKSWHHPDEPEKLVYQWMSPEKIKEWRGCLDDIAKELGQRIKKQEIAASIETGAKDRLFAKVAAFVRPTDSDTTSPE